MRYFIGIDQSLSCTGVVVIDNHTKKIIESRDISSKPPEPFFVSGVHHFTQVSNRAQYIVDGIEDVIKGYPPEESYVCMEHLASYNKKSRDTDYLLAHLFFSLVAVLASHSLEVVVVTSSSHKKLFFPPNRTAVVKKKIEEIKKVKKTVDKKKVEHDMFFESSLDRTGFTLSDGVSLESYDKKDAVCLAYFGSRIYFCDHAEVFLHRTPKQQSLGYNYQLEALKGALCSDTKRNSACWSCLAYDTCKDKSRYKGKSNMTKAWKAHRDSQIEESKKFKKDQKNGKPEIIIMG